MYKENKIVRIALSGDIVGALCTSPRRALDAAVRKHNAEGWNCRQVLPHSTSNLGVVILQLICLVCTLGLWTFGAGYLLLFERPLPAPGQPVHPAQLVR